MPTFSRLNYNLGRGTRNAGVDLANYSRTPAPAMESAITNKPAVYCVVSVHQDLSWEERFGVNSGSGNPKIIDPLTFNDAAAKVFSERADLLKRLAE